MNKHNTILYYK